MSIRHDWYQTDTKIVITVLLKNSIEKNYKVEIAPEKVIMIADNYHLELNLFRPIDVTKSSHKATPMKVEISLTKTTGERWETLERKKDQVVDKVENKAPPKIGPHDWDKLAKELTEEAQGDAPGDEALHQLFQKIYSESNEDVRRAMNKSFSESGGTVLSTNWKEVAEKKVEAKPPNGTEYKKWDS